MLLVVAEVAEAQSDSLVDVFPLRLGNKWTYQFFTEYSSSMAHSYSADTGLVEYEVTGAAFSPDTIHWQFIQRRSGQHSSYYLGHWDYRTISDSGAFEMIELNRGRHELYTPVFDGYRCFPFKKSDADSSRFFRFTPVDSLGRATVRVSFWDPANPAPEFSYKCAFIVSRDCGILQAEGGQGNFVAGMSMRYHLRDFRAAVPYPFLNIPHTNYVLTGLFGGAMDTTIAIRNYGLQPLTISGVVFTNPRFTVVGYTPLLPPLGDGSLSVRYYSSLAETTTASLVVRSDSPTSPDTVMLMGQSFGRATVSAYLRHRWKCFAYTGETRSSLLSIANAGNIPLLIDSVTVRNPALMIHRSASSLSPGKSTTDTLIFSPLTRSHFFDTLTVYSSAEFSPDRWVIECWSTPGGKITFSTHELDFGEVPGGHSRDRADTMINRSTGWPAIVRWFTGQSHNPPVTPFVNFPVQDERYWGPNEQMVDAYRFFALAPGVFSDTVVITIWDDDAPLAWEEIHLRATAMATGNFDDTTHPTQFGLKQNFPNPFNGSTSIGFEILEDTFVNLDVYDLLGRLVAALVGQPMKAGKYQRVFDGTGLASGVYFYRLQAASFVQTKRLVLAK